MSDPTEPVPGGGPPPGQYGAPPPYPQQGYGAPPRNPAQTLNLIATAVIIGGYVAAGAGLLAAIVALTFEDADGSFKLHQFLTDLSLGAGLGAIAVAAGHILRMRIPGGARY